MAGLIRVTAIPASRRRAGFAFTREPLVIGPESLGVDLAALFALAAIVGDPALKVEHSDEDTPEEFVEISHDDRQAILDMASAAELAGDEADAKAAIAQIVEGLIGRSELQSPEGPEDDDADDAGSDVGEPEPAPEAEGKADGDGVAPAADTTPASDASAAPGEQSGAGADAAGAPAADASEQNQPEVTQQPPVADGTMPAAAPAAEAANPVAPAPAAPTDTDPEKGDAVPAEAKAEAVAKPRSSSGRKPAAASKKAAKG